MRRLSLILLASLLALACDEGKTPAAAPAPPPPAEKAAAATGPAADAAPAAADGMTIALPPGQSSSIDPGPNAIVVALRRDGETLVNGVTVSDDELDRVFRDAFSRDRNSNVIIRPDKDVPHGQVVGVIERAKKAGLTRVAIAARH